MMAQEPSVQAAVGSNQLDVETGPADQDGVDAVPIGGVNLGGIEGYPSSRVPEAAGSKRPVGLADIGNQTAEPHATRFSSEFHRPRQIRGDDGHCLYAPCAKNDPQDRRRRWGRIVRDLEIHAPARIR